ncbi:MAG: hypothetical protein E3J42_02555 [Dehalococcoidia bacterium]|nr:MAG: hypothetical protein E3J42_02555 [Dehalococcoidia bacterium]
MGEYRVDEDLLIGGIDHGKWLMRAWYRKAFDAVKGDIRTVVVAIITAIIITVVTILILKWIGW